MSHWANESVFYQIYPLGLCGAPAQNDLSSPPANRLDELLPWLDHAHFLGANALYIGPIFESLSHGYDTVNYSVVDRRLGTNDAFARVCARAHELGLKVVLDAVFNHVGRGFPGFCDLQEKGRASRYLDWFAGVDFQRASPRGDAFTYEGWHGHDDLVKLDVRNPAVRDHLFSATAQWMDQFGIDGLRLDAADCLDLDFLRLLGSFCRARRADFWLLGEIIHGDYRRWAAPGLLDSVTNYECYKGLYSSHAEQNYFEIAWSLNRQFGPQGLYRGLPLYNFADNHDVSRVASLVKDPAQLLPLYSILFTMPGVPSVYYGSEWGIQATKDATDRNLRPRLSLADAEGAGTLPGLEEAIGRLALIRRASPALLTGDYRQIHVASLQFAFARWCREETVIVALNNDTRAAAFSLDASPLPDGAMHDLMDPGRAIRVTGGRLSFSLAPRSAAVISSAPQGR